MSIERYVKFMKEGFPLHDEYMGNCEFVNIYPGNPEPESIQLRVPREKGDTNCQ